MFATDETWQNRQIKREREREFWKNQNEGGHVEQKP